MKKMTKKKQQKVKNIAANIVFFVIAYIALVFVSEQSAGIYSGLPNSILYIGGAVAMLISQQFIDMGGK